MRRSRLRALRFGTKFDDARALALGVALGALGGGCRAVEEFKELVDSLFEMEDRRGSTAREERIRSRASPPVVRDRRELTGEPARPRLDLVIELRPDLPVAEIEPRLVEVLREFVRLEPHWTAVRVTAVAAKLPRLARPMGRVLLARDGLGWDAGGPRVTREQAVWVEGAAPTAGDVEILQVVDAKMDSVPEALAIAESARQLGVPRARVDDTVRRARAYFRGPPGR